MRVQVAKEQSLTATSYAWRNRVPRLYSEKACRFQPFNSYVFFLFFFLTYIVF
jgi:hypothetical protein